MLGTWAPIRRRHPQATLKCHYLLAGAIIGTTAYHLVEKKSSCRWYLLGAILLWVVCSTAVCTKAIVATKRRRNAQHEVVLNASNGLLLLDISLDPDWIIQPGQYLQLWMPRAGVRAFLQLPLFYVAVCDWDEGSNQRTVRMLARPQPGLTWRLYRDALASPRRLPVTLLGPYGRPDNLFGFGTVVFVVEDIGLFRALSYIEMLVVASRRREAMVRKMDILWQHGSAFGMPSQFPFSGLNACTPG